MTQFTINMEENFFLNFEKFKYESLSYMSEIINSFYVVIKSRTVRELS